MRSLKLPTDTIVNMRLSPDWMSVWVKKELNLQDFILADINKRIYVIDIDNP